MCEVSETAIVNETRFQKNKPIENFCWENIHILAFISIKPTVDKVISFIRNALPHKEKNCD